MLKESKISKIVKKIKNLDPFTMGLASGYGVNRVFQKGMAKRVVGETGAIQGMKPLSKEKRQLSNMIHGKDVNEVSKSIGEGAKAVYEKGEMPSEMAVNLGKGFSAKLPKRLRKVKGDKLDISFKDKMLYRAGKYGPTAMVVKAPVAGVAAVAMSDKRPKRPAQLPDNMEGWKSLDKNASEQYIKPKENTMLDNAEFQISFSDELHKIAKSGNHDEAVAFLKEGSAFTGAASKAWRALKRFGKNPVLKTKQKMQQASSTIGKYRSQYAPTRTGRMKGRSQQMLADDAVRSTKMRIQNKQDSKIRNLAEKHDQKAFEKAKMDRVTRLRDRRKYEPDVIARRTEESQIRNESIRKQKALKQENINKQKLEDKKIEVDKLKADAAAVRNQSIFTRVGGGLTSSDAPKGVKTLVGAGAVAVPTAAAYNMAMAEKKKKDNSIFKFGGKKDNKKSNFGMLSVKAGIDNNPNPTKADRIAGAKMKKEAKKKKLDFGMLSVKAGIDNNPKPTKADRIAGAKMKKEAYGSYAKPKKKVVKKKKAAKKAIKY